MLFGFASGVGGGWESPNIFHSNFSGSLFIVIPTFPNKKYRFRAILNHNNSIKHDFSHFPYFLVTMAKGGNNPNVH